MTLVLDAGALLALERNERPMWVRLKAAVLDANVPLTHAGVLAQVWRGGARQARLVLALEGIDIVDIDEDSARAIGRLLGAAQMSDVIDAGVVLFCRDGDTIVTSDPADLEALASTAGRHVEIIHP